MREAYIALPPFYWGLLIVGLVAACALDLSKRHVPNWLTVGLLVCGVTARLVHGSWIAGLWGIAAATVALLVLLVPFARQWVAGGDVKLMVACAVWLGPAAMVLAMIAAGLSGGLLALVYLLRAPRNTRQEMLSNLKLGLLSMRIVEPAKRPLKLNPPYAPAIAVGTVFAVITQVERFVQL